MSKGEALWKLDSRTIQRYSSYRDRTNMDKVTTREVYLCAWYVLSDGAIVTALRVTWWQRNSQTVPKTYVEKSGFMEAGLTDYKTVLVLSRSIQHRQSYYSKCVPVCLVRIVRL
jgi:hypothetical protein